MLLLCVFCLWNSQSMWKRPCSVSLFRVITDINKWSYFWDHNMPCTSPTTIKQSRHVGIALLSCFVNNGWDLQQNIQQKFTNFNSTQSHQNTNFNSIPTKILTLNFISESSRTFYGSRIAQKEQTTRQLQLPYSTFCILTFLKKVMLKSPKMFNWTNFQLPYHKTGLMKKILNSALCPQWHKEQIQPTFGLLRGNYDQFSFKSRIDLFPLSRPQNAFQSLKPAI